MDSSVQNVSEKKEGQHLCRYLRLLVFLLIDYYFLDFFSLQLKVFVLFTPIMNLNYYPLSISLEINHFRSEHLNLTDREKEINIKYNMEHRHNITKSSHCRLNWNTVLC